MRRKIFGQITDIAKVGTPLKGLKIETWDDDWPDGDDFMGSAITNVNGQYKISISNGSWD